MNEQTTMGFAMPSIVELADVSSELSDVVMYYEELEQDELKLLMNFNLICLRCRPEQKDIYEAKIKHIQSLIK